VTLIARLELYPSQCWYEKFDISNDRNVLACGNDKGDIHLYSLCDIFNDVESDDEVDFALYVIVNLNLFMIFITCIYSARAPAVLSHPISKVPVRQVTFSNDDRIIIGVSDDSTIWRWDRTN
jgi:hypothetical protein